MKITSMLQPAGTMLRSSRQTSVRGFSLIEVTLAVGIIAFAMLTVVALLPIGLSANQSAREQARATQTMNAIALCIRTATSNPLSTTTSSTQYGALRLPSSSSSPVPISNPNPANLTAAGAKKSAVLTWTMPVPSQNAVVIDRDIYLNDDGYIIGVNYPNAFPDTDRPKARLLAHVSLSAPVDKTHAGRAYIAVTWDPIAIKQKGKTWSNVVGTIYGVSKNYVETYIYFTAQ
jgi:type II secretory pathway pseudopilin PulG